jgi:tRNA pseudouridine55 synthase
MATQHPHQHRPRKRLPRRHVDGILVVDKPQEWTSHDVVAKIRGHFRLHKLGHAGTLDPVATGVLVLLAGRATKTSDHFSSAEKEYRFTARFGVVTDTQDCTGTVLQNDPHPPEHTAAQIEALLDEFRGDILQTPPMFSAVKIDGRRLYKLGRQGKVVEREPRAISIAVLELEDCAWPLVTFRAVCSKGTYVRTLCHDIGARLGTGACMDSLVRLRSGQFSLERAVSLDTVLSWTPDELPSHMLPIPEDALPQ